MTLLQQNRWIVAATWCVMTMWVAFLAVNIWYLKWLFAGLDLIGIAICITLIIWHGRTRRRYLKRGKLTLGIGETLQFYSKLPIIDGIEFRFEFFDRVPKGDDIPVWLIDAAGERKRLCAAQTTWSRQTEGPANERRPPPPPPPPQEDTPFRHN